MAAVVTVTPSPEGAPCPHNLIDLSGLSGTNVNVYRSAAGRRALVRGFKGRRIVGTAYALADYEAPFGIETRYDVECLNSSGVVVDTGASGPVVLDVADAWISDALSPTVSCAVTLGGDSLVTSALRRSGGVVPVNGATEPTGIGGVRRVGASIPISFRCESEVEENRVVSVLRSADPLVLRTPPDHRQIPRLAYITTDEWVVTIPEQGGGPDAWSKVGGVVDLVAAPAAAVVVPVRTYATVRRAESSYTTVRTRGSYLSILRG